MLLTRKFRKGVCENITFWGGEPACQSITDVRNSIARFLPLHGTSLCKRRLHESSNQSQITEITEIRNQSVTKNEPRTQKLDSESGTVLES
jgi:hypothetical protein